MVASKSLSWVGLGTLLLVALVRADENPEWTTPVAPFRIAGSLYYVGSRDLASYLVHTPKGEILINSNLESSAPQKRHRDTLAGAPHGPCR